MKLNNADKFVFGIVLVWAATVCICFWLLVLADWECDSSPAAPLDEAKQQLCPTTTNYVAITNTVEVECSSADHPQ